MSSEGDLVHRCLHGDTAAYRELMERYHALVYRLCCRLLRCRHDAEDVTQEVFVRVFRSLRSWDQQRPLRPWIVGIAINRCRTWLKRRSLRPHPVDYLADHADPREQDQTAELRAAILQALERLRTEHRAVFVLFHEQRCSYEEIAAALARPVGTVKTWLHRARLEILDQLRASGWVDDATSHRPPERLT